MVLPGGLVIFSGTASSALAMVPPDRDNSLSRQLRAHGPTGENPFTDAGVNPALLLEPQLRLETRCYSLTSHDVSGKSYINYRSDFLGWVPSRAYLAKAGIRTDGFWPATADQFQIAFKKAFPGGARGNIATFGPAGSVEGGVTPGKAESRPAM